MCGSLWQSRSVLFCYVALSCGRAGEFRFGCVCYVALWLGKAVRVRYGKLRCVASGFVRRKPIEAWFVVLGQLGLVEVGVLRLVGLRYGRHGELWCVTFR